jgi:hypothetical protein
VHDIQIGLEARDQDSDWSYGEGGAGGGVGGGLAPAMVTVLRLGFRDWKRLVAGGCRGGRGR